MLNPRKINAKMHRDPVITQIKENKFNTMLDELQRAKLKRFNFNMTQDEFRQKQKLANVSNERSRLEGQLYSSMTPGLRQHMTTRVTDLKAKMEKTERLLANPINYMKHINIK